MKSLREIIGEIEYERLEKRKYSENSYITSLHEDEYFYITKGNVVVSHNYIQSETLFPYIFGQDQLLGHLKYMSKYSHFFEYIAVSDVELLVIPAKIYLTWQKYNQNFLNYLHKLSFDINETSFLYNYLRLEKGFESCLAFIIHKFSQDGVFHYRNMTTLAKSFNTSRTTLYYYINKFEKLKIINTDKKKKFLILSVDRLKAIYDYNFLTFI